jgi:Asp-tRNA(Asn)/Glu-tRNA(Gln) amidotransferase A subunit family amidase
MTELHDLTAVEQCAALATGKVSPAELAGVQLTAGRHGADLLLLSLAAELETAIGWPHRHPPQWHQ